MAKPRVHMDVDPRTGKMVAGKDPKGHKHIDPGYPQGNIVDRTSAAKDAGKAIGRGIARVVAGKKK